MLQGLPRVSSKTDPGVNRRAVHPRLRISSLHRHAVGLIDAFQAKGADWRGYNRSLIQPHWAADPDERRAWGTHSITELAGVGSTPVETPTEPRSLPMQVQPCFITASRRQAAVEIGCVTSRAEMIWFWRRSGGQGELLSQGQRGPGHSRILGGDRHDGPLVAPTLTQGSGPSTRGVGFILVLRQRV